MLDSNPTDQDIIDLTRLKKLLDPTKSEEDCETWAKAAYPYIKDRAYFYSKLNPPSYNSKIFNWRATQRNSLKGITSKELKAREAQIRDMIQHENDLLNRRAAQCDILKGITSEELKAIEAQIRDMIQHENDLLNHRIQWFLIINGFLLTATASLKSKPSSDTLIMLAILAVVGLCVCISFWFSLGIGRRGVGQLADMWQHYRDLFYQSEKPNGCHQIGVLGWRASERASKAAPWYSLPIIFGIVWSFLICTNVFMLYTNTSGEPVTVDNTHIIHLVQPSGQLTKILIDPLQNPTTIIQLPNGKMEIKSPNGAVNKSKKP